MPLLVPYQGALWVLEGTLLAKAHLFFLPSENCLMVTLCLGWARVGLWIAGLGLQLPGTAGPWEQLLLPQMQSGKRDGEMERRGALADPAEVSSGAPWAGAGTGSEQPAAALPGPEAL